MPLARKIGTFASLSFAEKLAFAEAVLLLFFAKILVNLVPLSQWRNQIEGIQQSPPKASEQQIETARLVGQAIGRVGRNIPLNFLCMPQALSARWMLSRRGIANRLFLGTKKTADSRREFHAWLKVDDMMITGNCDETEYVLLGPQ